MKKIFMLLALAFSLAGLGQAPVLVKNINPNTTDPNSHSDPSKADSPDYPDTAISVNGKLIFPARNFNGIELWRSNGTAASTSLIRDITSGYPFASSNPQFLTRIGSDVYFFTADWDYTEQRYKNYRLKRYNGVANEVDNSFDIRGLDDVHDVVTANGKLFFIGINNEYNPYNITDTSLLMVDVNFSNVSVLNNGRPRELKVFNDYIVFDADNGSDGRELWLYDINNNNTYLAEDINQNSGGSSNPHDFVAYNNAIYFTADEGNGQGAQLRYHDIANSVSGGTTVGPYDANPHNKIVFNDQLYFRTNDSTNNEPTHSIYRYDAGNSNVDFVATDTVSTNGSMAVANGYLFFAADDGNGSENELWQTDGSNTYMAIDANPYGSGNPRDLTALGNTLIFTANDGNSYQPYFTDGSSAGLILHIQPFYISEPVKIIGTHNGYAYLYADDGVHGKELWKTDGTAANTSLVKDINLGDNGSIGSNIAGLDSLNGNVYFGATNGTEYGIYKSNGSAANTTVVANGSAVGFDYAYYSSDHIKTVGNTIFFDANAYNTTGYELWKTDGTQAGTVLVKDINPGDNWSFPNQMTACNGQLFFVADNGTNGYELWKSNGTTAGTILVKDIALGINSSDIRNLKSAGNKVFFVANDGTNGEEAWVSDGTAAGTFMLKDINPGAAGSTPQNLKTVNGKLYFSAENPTYGSEPWISDGTVAGTNLLKDVRPGVESSGAGFFAALGSSVYFSADSSGNGSALWRTDGTTAGTQFFHPAGFPFNLTNFGTKIGFICFPSNLGQVHGFEMWATDGTYSGTKKLTDFGNPGVGSFYIVDYPAYKNHWFVYADDVIHGMELWQTDGTPTGTFINDVAPGAPSSYPFNIGAANSALFFGANDGSANGYELWKLNVSSSVTWLSFTATKQDTAHALLQWATASESGNNRFVIEHSRDNISFDSSGVVPAGSPNGATYSFTDTLFTGANYYRLRQIDNVGIISFSNTEYLFRIAPLRGGIIRKSETICPGVVPSLITDSIPASGGTGTYTFQWQDSTLTGNAWVNIAGATNITYQPPALTTTKYYRRRVMSDTASAFSNTLIKMLPAVPDTTLAVDTAWRVYVYNGNDLNLSPANTQFVGYYTDTTKNVNTQNQWPASGSPSLAARYIGCPTAGGDNFTLAMKRKGFAPGNYVLVSVYHDDGIRVFANRVQMFNNPNAVAEPYVSLGALTDTSVVEIRIAEGAGNALLGFTLITSELQPGGIYGQQSICSGIVPAQLNNNASAYGGPKPLQITYQWQDSTAGGTWQNISGATGMNYAPPALIITHYYRRAAGDGVSAVVFTNIYTITVLPSVTQAPVITKTGRLLIVDPVSNQPFKPFQWYRNGVLFYQYSDNILALQGGSYTAKFFNNCGSGPASNAIVFAADAVNQTINFPAIANIPYTSGAYVRLQASASSGLPVRYEVLTANATISGDTLFTSGAGLYQIGATQPGSDVYAPAQQVVQSFTVTAGSQTITFNAIPNKKYGDAPFTVSATSSSGLPVSYSVTSGNAAVSGDQVYITGAGPVTIQASQGGNGNYAAASNVVQSFCVGVSSVGDITGATAVCPATFKYAVPKIPGAIYEWSISEGGLLTSNADSVTVQWQTAGQHSLSVKAYSSCDAIRSTASALVVTVQAVVIPGAVSNMLPANGATGQQLPLTLSWIPGSNNIRYDLYVWDSATAQPATPYAAGLTAVSYTLPNSGFPYNKAYKWRIVSYSGCAATSGPVQTFRLIPLPDLLVSNIQVPATAFSAQPISVTWRVTNVGPGRTTLNQSWQDAVFLSFDSMPNFTITPNTNPAAWSQLDFPIKPLLLGTKSNVTALDSGQIYTNTLNFTLPPHYNFPLYVYVITNYAPSANSPQEMTLANDTAHAPSPIAVTLSPAPDLRVDSLVTPATTFSGSTINIKYKIRNYGAITLPGNNWSDKVYLSTSQSFNVNNAIALKAPKFNGTYYYNAPDAVYGNAGQLQTDSSFTRIAPVVIPNFIYGNYFIYVVTDAGNTVYEGSLENNNLAQSPVQIFLTPTPQLSVSSLTLPGNTLSTTQPIGVNWVVTNTGGYDNIQKNQGHYVKIVQNCNTCYQPPCYTYVDANGNTQVACPNPQPGYRIADSLDFGSSRWQDKIYLSRDSTGLDVNNALLLSSYLQPGNIYQPFGNLNPEFLDNPNIYNVPFLQYLGSGLPAYINPQTSGVNVGNVVKNGSTHPGNVSFSLPNNLAQGNYYLYVLANANDAVFEFPDVPHYKRSNVFTINRPDLSVPSVTVPATASSGQAIAINYAVQNGGPGSVFNQYRKDYVYISTSPVFDAAAVLIATPDFTENIPAGAQVQHQVNYTIPYSTSGTRYLYVFTNKDSSFRENSYANNINATPATISITLTPPPNLSVSNITAPDTIFAVTNFGFKYTVPNNGTTATNGSWIDSIFISCSPVYNPNSVYYVGRRSHNNTIDPGNSYTDSFALQVPYTFTINACFAQQNTPAYFFVKTNADNGLFEANSNDNVTGTGQKIIINPLTDLIVTSVSSATTATAGRPYPITWTDKNIGNNPGPGYYNSWYDGFYFSADTVLDAADAFAGNTYLNSPLNRNQSITNTDNTPIVPNITAGDYYLIVKANAYNSIYGGELNSANNTNLLRNGSGVAQKITVTVPPQPDLRDTILSAPVSVATGQSLPVVHRVTNYGVGVTYPSTWSDAVWLSSDFIPGNAGDIYLGAFNHSGALQPGGSYTDSLNLPININTPQGNYVLIIQTNSNGNIFETNTANNLAFRYVTVYRPAPSDLIVSNIIHPDTVLLGYPDTTVWTVQNISANNAVGVETDGLYLSKNNLLDSTATLMGVRVNTLDLSPLEKDTFNLAPLVQGVTEGTYYVMVKTDILNNIVETDKSNNTGLAVKQVYVKVKQLPLGVLMPEQLVTTGRYFKLIIPDSLRGATILLTLKSTDSLAANNRLYVGLGYIPSSSRFDYAFGTPNYGNQEILMPSVEDSVYYITVNNANNRPVQNITLLAVRLPFAIVRTQANQGGNSGNVTTKITGSLFTNNMTATLKRGSTVITASAVYYVNSTVVYATFNLQGATLGTYDLILTKPDTATAVLAQGFSVVPPNNGGLITGTGINTGQTGVGNAPGCAPGAASGLNAQLQTEIVIPPKVFAGWPFTIQIHYSNPTNVDIPVQTRIMYSLDGLPLSLTQSTVDAGTPSLYLEFSEPGGPPNIIRAGGSGTINVYSKPPANYPGHKLANYILK